MLKLSMLSLMTKYYPFYQQYINLTRRSFVSISVELNTTVTCACFWDASSRGDSFWHKIKVNF